MAISNISLTAGLQSNLRSLQGTMDLLNQTQARLSSGLKVNSALDNPLNYFTARNHRSDASDLSGFKDGMNEAIQTIKMANSGIESLTDLIDSAKSLANTAKAKVAGTGLATEELTFSGIQRGDQIALNGDNFTADNIESTLTVAAGQITDGDTITIRSITYTASATGLEGARYFSTAGVDADADAAALRAVILADTATTGVDTAIAANVITLTELTGVGVQNSEITITGSGNVTEAETAAASGNLDLAIGATEAETAILFATRVNNLAVDAGDFRATAVNNATVTLGSTTTDADASSVTTTAATSRVEETIVAGVGNERESLATQYQEIQSQISDLIADSGYAGVNLLNSGENLIVNFGNSHSLTIDGFNAGANVGNATPTSDWGTDTNIDTDIAALDTALDSLQTQASSLSNNLNIITIRQDFVDNKISELVVGADNLTLADTNEEAANMLMLQTRQALGTTALSLSSQAAQSVLRLF